MIVRKFWLGFGVFASASGKRTRKDDLKWAGLPLSFGKSLSIWHTLNYSWKY